MYKPSDNVSSHNWDKIRVEKSLQFHYNKEQDQRCIPLPCQNNWDLENIQKI